MKLQFHAVHAQGLLGVAPKEFRALPAAEAEELGVSVESIRAALAKNRMSPDEIAINQGVLSEIQRDLGQQELVIREVRQHRRDFVAPQSRIASSHRRLHG